MSVEPKPRPLAHLWETAKEYLTHWFTAGVILTLTGFFWGYLFIAMSLSGLERDAEAQQQMNKVRQLEPTVTCQNIEELWNHMLRKPGHAEKMIALLRLVWRD
ncbi:MAG: hypothetical protein ACSLFJ_01330 [Immundisolibacter sp.]|uniref:hypothetical protein n=1 Tax=Immundisolibacter sp. TaxID=1934948 RepID=UPI003EE1045F